MADRSGDPDEGEPWWRDLWRSLGVACGPSHAGRVNIIRLRFRWGLIVVGFVTFMASRDAVEPNDLLHLVAAVLGLWVLAMAIFWNRPGSRPWWKAPHDDE